MGSYTALNYRYMWRNQGGGPTPGPDPSRGSSKTRLILALLEGLSTAELLQISLAATSAAARRSGEAQGPASATAGHVVARNEEEAPAAKFRARRPFHPGRLAAAFKQAQASLSLRPTTAESGSEAAEGGGAGGGREGLHGIAWLATQPNLQAAVRVDGEGSVVVEPGGAWWACIPRSKWPPGLEAEIAPLWEEPHGERGTELQLPRPVGAHEEAAVRRLAVDLEAALVRDGEWQFSDDPRANSSQLEDPYAHEWETALKATEGDERAAKIEDDVRSAFATKTTTTSAFASAWARPQQYRNCVPCGGEKIAEAKC